MAGWGLAVCGGLLLVFSGECVMAAREAAGVFTAGVLPALFPMMVLAGLPWGRRRKRSGQAAFWGAVLFAFGAGSPAGARKVAALEGRGPLGPWFVTAGVMSPLFFLGTLAGWTGKGGAMGLLLAVHWACALLTGALAFWAGRRFSPLACPPAVNPMQGSIQPGGDGAGLLEKEVPSLGRALPQAIFSAAQALLAVCGAMMLFGVAAAVLKALLLRLCPGGEEAGALPLALVHAFLEIGGGAYALLKAAESAGMEAGVLYPLLCAACSFGGLSIWLQNLAYTGQSIRPGALLLYRAVHGALSFGVSFGVFALWPRALTAGAFVGTGPVAGMAGLTAGIPPQGWAGLGLLMALASFAQRSRTCSPHS